MRVRVDGDRRKQKVAVNRLPPVELEAVNALLQRNGMWLVEVHERRIVKLTHVPRAVDVESFLEDEAGGEAGKGKKQGKKGKNGEK